MADAPKDRVSGDANEATPRTPAEERVEALLALSSQVPDGLDARILARRAAGDRVDLLEAPEGRSRTGRRVAWAVAGLGLAAAAAALLWVRREPAASAGGATPIASGADSGRAVVAVRPADSVRQAPRDTARATTPAIGGYALTPPRGALVFSRSLRDSAGATLDSVVRAARGVHGSVVVIEPASAPERGLASAIAAAVERVGIPRTRIRVESPAPIAGSPAGSVRVDVRLP